MYDFPRVVEPWPADPARDMALAENAALYLERQGLGRADVVRCLIEEFDLSPDTAWALAALAA